MQFYSLFTIHLFSIYLFSFKLNAQYDHESVLYGIEGEVLMTKLVEDYKPATVLTYGEARDTLFANIDVRNDSLFCVYSGHKLYLDPNEDPTTYVYLDGIDDGINTEHTYPRSKGAENGNARSDMHHLYPTRIRVNADRGNFPFDEIPDDQTTKWYYLNGVQSSIPDEHIDLFSEGTSEYFEPKEAHKGNVARSIFYFYTMYREEAEAADPDFFPLQKETLCAWHNQDPVDSVEWVRTFAIAAYQDDKVNPFVLDCTLAGRTYCDMVTEACSVVKTTEIEKLEEDILVFPNPAQNSVTINLNYKGQTEAYIFLYRMDGTLAKTIAVSLDASEKNHAIMKLEDTESGLYILNILFIYKNKTKSFSTRLMIE